jgi:hypothetical protein
MPDLVALMPFAQLGVRVDRGVLQTQAILN